MPGMAMREYVGFFSSLLKRRQWLNAQALSLPGFDLSSQTTACSRMRNYAVLRQPCHQGVSFCRQFCRQARYALADANYSHAACFNGLSPIDRKSGTRNVPRQNRHRWRTCSQQHFQHRLLQRRMKAADHWQLAARLGYSPIHRRADGGSRALARRKKSC